MPTVPSSMAVRMRSAAGQKRRWNSTPNVAPAAAQASIMRRAAGRSMAIGFSHSTCAPLAAAAVTTASCVGCGVQTETTSTAGSSVAAVGMACRAAKASARAASTSTQASTSAPAARNATTWLAAMLPHPTMATCMVFPFLDRLDGPAVAPVISDSYSTA